jgi:uncharacterized protein YndB with AHSA1/START domain
MRDDRPGLPIRWRMHITVPPERVYAALDSSDGRASFWAESAIETASGIEFHFANGDRFTCRVHHRRPPFEWALEYFEGIARFELTPDGHGGTDLMLTHSGVSAEEWHETHTGWLNVLFPLKAWLVHGVDLRNHDPDRTWDKGYADQ